jgi:peptidyl-prolyl cis-trans isomerase SurA
MTLKHTRITPQAQLAPQSPAVATRTLAGTSRFAARLGTASLLLLLSSAAFAQTTQTPTYQVPRGSFPNAPQLQLPHLPSPTPITPNGVVVEDVIARINDQIITRSEYERAEQQMLQDAQQQNASEAALQDHLHDLLRDMIDSDLLISKGKELGITCDAETIRQLDEIRKQNHLPDLEALEKAAAQQGVSFEDFKQNIRNQCIRQSVVREEVGRHLNMTHASEEAYYNAHAKDFTVPEQIHLSEILIPTPENATDAQIAQSQAKADEVAAKLKAGANFADLAKSTSGGPTAAAGGDLGDFKRGALGSQLLEDATFSLAAGANTAPIRTRQGFVILKVDAHQAAGVPPLASVENQVQEAIYMDQLQPALRAYLTKARADAFLEVSPGFVDTGSGIKNNNANFAYTAYQAPAIKRKIQNKQRLEQARAVKAQAALAAARQRVAEKNQAKAEADKAKLAGAKNTSGKPQKKPKIRREKIRFGEAPRNALPAATSLAAADTTPQGAPLAGVAPGVAMAPTESVVSITTGVGTDQQASNDLADPLAPIEGPVKKTRFSTQQTKAEVDRANNKLNKAESKATLRPVAATREQSTAEKVQAAPLGLNGDTVKKKKKAKAPKGAPKERLQEVQKPVETAAPIAPTVNPAVTGSPLTSDTPATKKDTPSSDNTVLPSAAPTAPGANPTGQPIPAATSAQPGQPATTPSPH